MAFPYWLCLPIAVLTSCSSGGSNTSSDGGTVSLEPPAECALQDTPADWVYPAGPYGAEVGDTLKDFELEDCLGNKLRLGDLLSQSELVLFNIGAGWCEPCIAESETLDAEIFRNFCGQGLRVVQVLFEDEVSRPASKFFCSQWSDRFTLSFPVLVDPLFVTSEYFASVDSQTPINFLVAPSGEILFKEVGTPAADLPDRIDALLAP